jgi:DNA-binding NarL/FixJ family response regulator
MSAPSNPVGVLVAEDHGDLRAALCEMIAAEPDLQVTGTAGDLAELLEVIRATTAQVLVLDLDLAGKSSMPALQAFRAVYPQRAIVVYSGHEPGPLAPEFARLGGCEYVTKTGDAQPLLEAIRRGARNATGAGN